MLTRTSIYVLSLVLLTSSFRLHADPAPAPPAAANAVGGPTNLAASQDTPKPAMRAEDTVATTNSVPAAVPSPAAASATNTSLPVSPVTGKPSIDSSVSGSAPGAISAAASPATPADSLPDTAVPANPNAPTGPDGITVNLPNPASGANGVPTPPANAASPTKVVNSPSAEEPGLLAQDQSRNTSAGLVSTPIPPANPPTTSSGELKAPASVAPTPSVSFSINLINRLVKSGALTKADAEDLIQQATDDMAKAQAQAQTAAAAPPQTTSGVVALAGTPQTTPAESADDEVKVTYVPDLVKNQITDEVRDAVMTQARAQNWAAPNQYPNWLSRISFFGDLRFRYQANLYPKGNDNTGSFVNFNAINTGAPYDTRGSSLPPTYDVDKTRQMLRLRARFGADINLDPNFTAGLRLATGADDSPVTENQTLGSASSGQGGNFGKYSVWLDRAFLKYSHKLGENTADSASVEVGRFENPFFHTSMIFADDLGFDGIAFQARYHVEDNVAPFGTIGVFPVYNTDLNFGSTNPSKYSSEDKWLYGAQAGVSWKINQDYEVKVAAAFYDFDSIEGKISDPFTPLTTTDAGSTDASRPLFAQNGNTYQPIRNIALVDGVNTGLSGINGSIDQFQYYGLATPFREAALTARLDYNHLDPFHIWATAEMVDNIAFNKSSVNNVAVNNRANTDTDNLGSFGGGNVGAIFQLNVGSATLEKLWDWNAFAGYRYVESDATPDGFADADFGGNLTGTNLKGYTLGGAVAFSPRVWANLRWMSAEAVAGPPLNVNTIQIDVNAKF